MNLDALFLLPRLWPLLLLVPLAWLALFLVDRKREHRLRTDLGARGRKVGVDLSARGRRWRRRLAVAGLAGALVTLLQPTWGEGLRAHEQRGVDILVCLDVSRSMLARDQEPHRLGSAHRELAALVERLRGDRLGLVAFAGSSTLVVPLTLDKRSFLHLARQTGPESVARGGTDLGGALDRALAALGDGDTTGSTILLLTDGEDHAGRGAAAAARCLARGVRVHTVGFGTERGSKIALAGTEGEAFLRDRGGAEVITGLDRPGLERLAAAGGGEFVAAASLPLALVELYEKRILPLARKALEIRHRPERRNRYQWPLLAAFLLWILALCITERQNGSAS